MTININIKATVDNLTLSQIYELISKFTKKHKTNIEILEFNGLKFKIEASVKMSIDYVITEIK